MNPRLNSFLNWFSAICTSITVAAVVWRGGALANTLEEQNRRLTNLEMYGSGQLQQHKAMDDQRTTDLEARIRRIEALTDALTSLRAEIAGLRERLDGVKERLNTDKPIK